MITAPTAYAALLPDGIYQFQARPRTSLPVFDARAWLTPTEKYFGGIQVTANSKCTKPLRHRGLYSFDSGETKFPIAANGTVATTKYKVGGEVRGTAKLKGKLNGSTFTGTITGKFRGKLLGRCTLKQKFKTVGQLASQD